MVVTKNCVKTPTPSLLPRSSTSRKTTQLHFHIQTPYPNIPHVNLLQQPQQSPAIQPQTSHTPKTLFRSLSEYIHPLKRTEDQHRVRSATPDEKSNERSKASKELKRVALRSTCALESKLDFQLRKARKLLLDLQRIVKIFVVNTCSFRGVPMVTTFIRTAGNHTHGV